MNPYLVLCFILFILIFIFSVKLFSKQLKDRTEDGKYEMKMWKNMGGKSAFYRITVLASLLSAALLTYLIKMMLE